MKNMHYGVSNREDFTHNNMVANTSRRDFEVNNGTYQDRKLQLHSGIDRTFYHKKENTAFFKPTKDLTHVNGAPVMAGELQSRYIPDIQKNHSDLPFENKIKVIPGINGMNQEGRNQVYRILPKNVDELRSKENRKLTFKAKKIHAVKKGELRGAVPNLTKDKLPTHRHVNFNDLVANKAQVTKHKKTGLIKKPSGQRSTKNNYINPAKNSNMGSGPSKNKSSWRKSKKITLEQDNQRNISNVINKNQIQNKKSYKAYNTQRVTTNYEEKGHVHNSTMGTYTYDPNDVPLTTLRELMIHNDNITGVVSNNTREYVFSKDMIIPNTHREGYTTANHIQGVSSNIKTAYANNQDNARKTTRQTTQFNNHQSNARYDVGAGYSRDRNDKARNTVKQTTQFNKHQGNTRHEIATGYSRDKNDKARNTVKQTTQFNKHQGNARHDIEAGYSRDKNDKARNTIKESTLFTNPEMNLTDMNLSHYARTKGDVAKTTIRQSTLHSTPHINVASNEASYHRNKGEKAKPTIRQTTLHSTPHINMASNEASYHRNKGEKAKPTIRQTTLHSTPHMNVAGNDGSYKRSKNDRAKTTIRETTAHTNHTGGLGAEVELPRDRTDVNNICIDDRREILTYNRLPGGKHDGPHVIDKKSYELKEEVKYEREYLNKHKPIDRNIIDENINAIYSRNKDKVKKIENEYRINYNFVSELEKNPYTNNLVHQKKKLNKNHLNMV